MNEKEKNVLWIDDRIFFSSMEVYRHRLKVGGIDVIPVSTLEDALVDLRDRSKKYEMIIFDIAMPPVETGPDVVWCGAGDTANGTRAGFVLLKRIMTDSAFEHLSDTHKIVFTQIKVEPGMMEYCKNHNIPLLPRIEYDEDIEDVISEILSNEYDFQR